MLGWAATVIAVAVMVRIAWDLARDPWAVLDLRDSNGRNNHGKVAGLLTFTALYILAWGYLAIQRDLHWMIWSLLAVLPFGLIGLRTYFGARRQTMAPPDEVVSEKGDDG